MAYLLISTILCYIIGLIVGCNIDYFTKEED